MAKKQLNHFSPKFANKYWSDESSFMAYLTNRFSGSVDKESKGRCQWGRQRGLYSRETESALNRDLENDAAVIYEKLCRFEELRLEDRVIWAQFLLSQLVRTPGFMNYEQMVNKSDQTKGQPVHDRVGCKDCIDLETVISRSWCFLLAHPDDFFIRTDNPVLLTGFLELPSSCLYYPLTPHICFVSCSMPADWQPHRPSADSLPMSCRLKLEKGGAWMLNYYMARAAQETLILRPDSDSDLATTMFGEVLGGYPQPPFMLHHTSQHEAAEAYESVRMIMSVADGVNYPRWNVPELELKFPGGTGASAA